VKVRAPGRSTLTTQLYFPDDPNNADDPWFLPELLVATSAGAGETVARFDFVLP
jgi:protocatechuate 3,4-dioxygenase beta subunit